MALATMDDELYKKVQQFVENHSLDYPTASFFINQAVKEKLEFHKKASLLAKTFKKGDNNVSKKD